MSVENQPRPNDIPPQKEREQSDQYAGLHARLLLADKDFMDPDKEFPRGKHLKRLPKRNYQPFERTSEHDRKKHWESIVEEKNMEDSGKAAYALWEENIISNINDFSKEKREEIFNPLFKQMGIVKSEGDEFSKDDTKVVYDRYFSKEKREKDPKYSGVKQFVRDVLEMHTENGNVQMDKLKQHLPDIKHFAVIFGEESAEMIEQLIVAEARFKTEPNFVKKLSSARKNNLQPQERRILEHINAVYQEEKAEKKQALMEKLPIMEYRDDIRHRVSNEDTMLLVGGTGCGKTVGFPFMIREIMEEERDQGKDPGQFIITEPTVINTDGLTRKIASDGVATLGEEVDLQHSKREGSYNKDSDTVLMTTQTLVNMFLRKDKEIQKMRRLMIDEAHGFSLPIVIMLALAKEEQQRRKDAGEPSLDLSVVSATIDEEAFRKYLGVSEIMKIPGAIQTIHERFPEESVADPDQLPEAAAHKVKDIINSGEDGDIIIFVAGGQQIEDTITEIHNTIGNEHGDVELIGLESKSSQDIKDKATAVSQDGKRRIIVSTNFAETGITIQGLKHVIDTGLKKENIYNPQTGLSNLEVVMASRDECMQRRGRVGRIEPGTWYPLYTQANFNGEEKDAKGALRPLHIVPEIMQTDLSGTVLTLKQYGKDIRDLDLLAEPSVASIDAAEDRLIKLGALKKENGTTEITDIGREMAKMSIDIEDIHYQRMMAEVRLNRPQVSEKVAAMVALLEKTERGPLFLSKYEQEEGEDMPQGNMKKLFTENAPELIDPDSDFITLYNTLEAFQSIEKDDREKWALDRGLSPDKLERVLLRKGKLMELARGSSSSGSGEPITLEEIISLGYADRVMMLDPENDGVYLWEDGTEVDFAMLIGNSSFTRPDRNAPYPQRILSADIRMIDDGDRAFLSKVQVIEGPELESSSDITEEEELRGLQSDIEREAGESRDTELDEDIEESNNII